MDKLLVLLSVPRPITFTPALTLPYTSPKHFLHTLYFIFSLDNCYTVGNNTFVTWYKVSAQAVLLSCSAGAGLSKAFSSSFVLTIPAPLYRFHLLRARSFKSRAPQCAAPTIRELLPERAAICRSALLHCFPVKRKAEGRIASGMPQKLLLNVRAEMREASRLCTASATILLPCPTIPAACLPTYSPLTAFLCRCRREQCSIFRRDYAQGIKLYNALYKHQATAGHTCIHLPPADTGLHENCSGCGGCRSHGQDRQRPPAHSYRAELFVITTENVRTFVASVLFLFPWARCKQSRSLNGCRQSKIAHPLMRGSVVDADF